MIRPALTLAALPLLALAGACTMNGDTRPAPEAGVQCNANALDALVGKARSPDVEAQALRLSGAKTVRWLGPDSAMTMDFRVDRLNLTTDADGKITGSRCG